MIARRFFGGRLDDPEVLAVGLLDRSPVDSQEVNVGDFPTHLPRRLGGELAIQEPEILQHTEDAAEGSWAEIAFAIGAYFFGGSP